MMQRFAEAAGGLVGGLYGERVERARTSYRPVEIAGRRYSPLKDDTRLHVDAFPSRPLKGRRILRLFANIDPSGAPRVWRVGEPFEAMAASLLPKARRPSRARAWLLAAVGATRGVRSPYDALMLGLHDAAKRDEAYQAATAQAEVRFAAGSAWLCFTDQVMHAALAGQYALEQTFHLDVAAMARPELSAAAGAGAGDRPRPRLTGETTP